MNLSVLTDMAADAFGDRVVVGRRSSGCSAEQLRRLSVGGAARIGAEGATAVIYLDVNGAAFPVALLAAARAGVPLVPLNFRLGADQLRALIGKHPGAVAITADNSAALFAEVGMRSWSAEQWLSAAQDSTGPAAADVAPDATAVIIYTSGTTAEPKGVVLRHANLVSYVLGTVEFAGAGPGDTSLVSVPPYHVAAVANVITNLYAGRRSIVLEEFTGAQWLALARAESVTNALVVPTMLARIMAVDGDRAVPSLRTLAYGGAAMPVRVIEEALGVWEGVEFVNAYGLTETSSTISVLGPLDHRLALSSADPAVRARLASAGRAVDSVEIQIRDDAGRTLGPHDAGQIWVRGDQVSGEYAGTGSVLDAEGFFDTRDTGYLDADGYLFVGGRSDDIIIRGGENIAPAEIEATLLSVDGVLDAAVVGIPDPVWTQHIEAVVVARPGHTIDTEAVRAYVRARLRSSKTPDRILQWDGLPRTDLGKLIRRRVVEGILADDASNAGVTG